MAFMSESDEKESLIMSTPTTTKVVYFLKPSMSKALLCKFPDNSFAFDFDYTQSSIWSPLVPRLHSAMDLDIKPRNRRFSIGNGKKNKLKKLTSNIKNKLNVTTFNLNLNPFNNNKINPSHFSETPLKTTCYPPTTKVFSFFIYLYRFFFFNLSPYYSNKGNPSNIKICSTENLEIF